MDGLTRIKERRSKTGAPIEFRLVSGDLIDENDVFRHDPGKLARLLLDICRGRPDPSIMHEVIVK